jgi:pSer/pThr/pTyr-binding forkhead associated (FHA) protein
MNQSSPTKDKPVLLVVDGPLRGQQWVMHEDVLVVGRGPECNIVIAERPVSRQHLRIWRKEQKFYVEDLKSKNGTHLNGMPLTGVQELRDGDEIQVALSVKFKFIGSEATVPLSLDSAAEVRGRLTLDPNTHQVTINGKRLDPPLSLYQYRLLELLYEKRGGICTRDEVIRVVWPEAQEEGVSEQAIDALVRRLRDRLAEIDGSSQLIATVRGHGFRIVQSEEQTDNGQ